MMMPMKKYRKPTEHSFTGRTLPVKLASVTFRVKQTVVAKSNHVVGSGCSRARKLLLLWRTVRWKLPGSSRLSQVKWGRIAAFSFIVSNWPESRFRACAACSILLEEFNRFQLEWKLVLKWAYNPSSLFSKYYKNRIGTQTLNFIAYFLEECVHVQRGVRAVTKCSLKIFQQFPIRAFK